ncbi:MAG TPA: DUF6445 family protein [Allosphingosinicella sp.]|jgi:hypothetical protein
MRTSLVIVDDFIDNAPALRQAALQLTYPQLEGPFPGRNSLQRINMPGLADEVSHILGEPLEPLSPPLSHCKARITLARDKGKAKVHMDPGYWSGILYLSRPEDCRGGTEFFRHLPTGSDRAPLDEAELAARGFASWEEMHEKIIERDSVDDAKWEKVMEVPMRFNRLVLLRPWLWHTAGPGFGDSLQNGRLVFLMFFQLRK